jgi:hypothetical protein
MYFWKRSKHTVVFYKKLVYVKNVHKLKKMKCFYASKNKTSTQELVISNNHVIQ